MIPNSAESPPIFADVSLVNQPIKKHFLLTKKVLLQILIFNCHLSARCGGWLALCDAKFTIAGIEAPDLKFMTILETLTTGQLKSDTISQNRKIQIAK